MASVRIRERSWRFYRNWLIHFTMWITLLIIALGAARRPWPLFVYLLLAYPIYLISASIFYAYRTTHPGGRFAMQRVTPTDAGMAYETVEFPSRDGLSLFGWYLPGNSKGTIILVHGHGGKGISMIYHASALVSRGYSVLMYDQRAHGSSEGDICTAGWREVEDLLGAIDYLKTREDVNPERIGALGLSMGGQAVLLAAARENDLRAVVAEGTSPAGLQDYGGRPQSLIRWINLPFNWLFYQILTFMNGAQPQDGILATIADISPRPVMLISGGGKKEMHFSQIFYDAAAEPKDLWIVPKARHAEAYFRDPKTYQRRVVEFFDQALNTEISPTQP